MSDAPPQLGDIPKQSEFNIPTITSTSAESSTGATTKSSLGNTESKMASSDSAATGNTSSIENAKTTAINTAQSAMDTIANHPITKSTVDTIANHPITKSTVDTVTNGPVAQSVKEQSAKTSAEASNLAATRKTPDTRAATGQPLTHYHSFFYSLLAWEHPRVTAISYLTIVTSIFIFRYAPVLRLTFKLLAYALGSAAVVEGVGQIALSQSILSAFRPRKYFTLPRESLESALEDVEQLLNFFVIEIQRLIFAEDASKTFVAFLASFIAYWLVKFTPVWGLSLIAVTTIYFVPLIYISEKEIIDEQLDNMSKMVNAQTAQMKDLAAHHTANATESLKAYTGDLSKQAQEYIGSARRSISPAARRAAATASDLKNKVTPSDFPSAPKQEPTGVKTTADQEHDDLTQLATGAPAS